MNDPDAGPAREPRASVIIRALAQTPHGATEHRVRNLSRTGACLDHDGALTVGMTLRLTMGAVQGVEAEVMWVRAALAGVRFAWPVDLAQARRPRGSAPVPPSAGWVVEVADPYRRYG